MISHVVGTVTSAGATTVVVDVGGIGLELHCSPATAASVTPGQPGELAAALVVREDSLTLYGFATLAEREAFQLVQTASGVGPKLALALVSVLAPEQLKAAILQEDLVALCRVPGIGRKGAQKLVIELKEKALGLAGDEAVAERSPSIAAWREQVVDGLQGLGWSAKDAERASDAIAPLAAETPQAPIGTLMRAALASLAKH